MFRFMVYFKCMLKSVIGERSEERPRGCVIGATGQAGFDPSGYTKRCICIPSQITGGHMQCSTLH